MKTKKEKRVTKFVSLEPRIIELIEKLAQEQNLSFSTYLNWHFNKLQKETSK